MTADLPLGAIVVGVDGHPQGMYAAAWAARQADLEHRPLVVVHASGTGPRLLTGHAGGRHLVERLIAQRHADRGKRRALEVAPGIRVTTLVRAADPAKLLVDLAATAHMLVVGSRGLGAVGSLLRGSVSLAVCASAACPVVVARGEVPRSPRIVVGTDGTEASAAAIEFAFAQASLRGVPLTVLYAVSVLEPRPEKWVSAVVAAPSWLSESVAGMREKYLDVEVDLRVVDGPTVVELTEASLHADLVVIGAQPHRGPARLHLTSVGHALLDHGSCSVAIVRPHAPDPASQRS
jgi:nucleotide-binding universal stress UspA family protein